MRKNELQKVIDEINSEGKLMEQYERDGYLSLADIHRTVYEKLGLTYYYNDFDNQTGFVDISNEVMGLLVSNVITNRNLQKYEEALKESEKAYEEYSCKFVED